jgi:hypothetical protein
MNTLLWSLIVAAYALSIWVWTSDFGKQFPRRSRRRHRIIAAGKEEGTALPKWAA